MAKNLKFYYRDGAPCARGPHSERVLMNFLETDIQGDDHVCHDLMEDILALEAGTADGRAFVGNAHQVELTQTGVTIECMAAGASAPDANIEQPDSINTRIYKTGLKHFREILEDWEAFILDENEVDDSTLQGR